MGVSPELRLRLARARFLLASRSSHERIIHGRNRYALTPLDKTGEGFLNQNLSRNLPPLS